MDLGLPERLEKEGGKLYEGRNMGKKTSKYTQILDGLLNYTCGRDWEGLLKTSTWEVQIYKAEISAVAYIKGKQFGLWGHPKLSASTKINTLQRKITESRVSTMFCPKHPLQKDKLITMWRHRKMLPLSQEKLASRNRFPRWINRQGF